MNNYRIYRMREGDTYFSPAMTCEGVDLSEVIRKIAPAEFDKPLRDKERLLIQVISDTGPAVINVVRVELTVPKITRDDRW